MPIEYFKGDMLWSDDDIIVHGCNCFCTMGHGIARQIKEVYPGAYMADQRTKCGDRTKLGTFTNWVGRHAHRNMDVCVVNAYTQYDFGKGKKHFDPVAFRNVCIRMRNFFDKNRSMGMPKIGAGLAKGDWNEIESIINEVFDDRLINVYILE